MRFSGLILATAIVVGVYAASRASGLIWAGPAAITAGCAAIFLLPELRSNVALFGMGRPTSWARFAGVSLLAFLLGYLAAGIATVTGQLIGLPAPGGAVLQSIPGDFPLFVWMLILAWTTAAFGEEFLFRGFLQSQLTAAFGEQRGAVAAAVVLQAALFGLSHAYQGARGVFVAGAIGLVFGAIHARFRCLWALVLAHGLIDTVGLTALYLGAQPG